MSIVRQLICGFRSVRSLVFCVVFCRSLFVLLSFFLWLLCCLSFFDLWLLITSLSSANFSYKNNQDLRCASIKIFFLNLGNYYTRNTNSILQISWRRIYPGYETTSFVQLLLSSNKFPSTVVVVLCFRDTKNGCLRFICCVLVNCRLFFHTLVFIVIFIFMYICSL